MAFDDVEKRLNSSLDDLIASSKKVGAGKAGRVRDFASALAHSGASESESRSQNKLSIYAFPFSRLTYGILRFAAWHLHQPSSESIRLCLH